MSGLRIMSLKNKQLFYSDRKIKGEKWGTPENEGMSVDVYENKCRIIQHFEFVQMCMKPHDLRISSEYVYENKGEIGKYEG